MDDYCFLETCLEIFEQIKELKYVNKVVNRTFDMPDTFYSWFLVTELHVWMLSVSNFLLLLSVFPKKNFYLDYPVL